MYFVGLKSGLLVGKRLARLEVVSILCPISVRLLRGKWSLQKNASGPDIFCSAGYMSPQKIQGVHPPGAQYSEDGGRFLKKWKF